MGYSLLAFVYFCVIPLSIIIYNILDTYCFFQFLFKYILVTFLYTEIQFLPFPFFFFFLSPFPSPLLQLLLPLLFLHLILPFILLRFKLILLYSVFFSANFIFFIFNLFLYDQLIFLQHLTLIFFLFVFPPDSVNSLLFVSLCFSFFSRFFPHPINVSYPIPFFSQHRFLIATSHINLVLLIPLSVRPLFPSFPYYFLLYKHHVFVSSNLRIPSYSISLWALTCPIILTPPLCSFPSGPSYRWAFFSPLPLHCTSSEGKRSQLCERRESEDALVVLNVLSSPWSCSFWDCY